MDTYTDYRFRFTNLTTALQAMAALRTAGVLGQGELPENMLGDPRDNSGALVSPYAGTATWLGRRGSAALTYTDPDTGATVTQPAKGDPTYWYIHIRSTVPPNQIPFDPAAYGLTASATDESAQVLGVWA